MKLADYTWAIRLLLKSRAHIKCIRQLLNNNTIEWLISQPYDNTNTKAGIDATVKSYFWASRLIGKNLCLPRSIALYQNLKNRGFQVDHKLGACQSKNKVMAHAWVEHQGLPLNESKDIKNKFVTFENHTK